MENIDFVVQTALFIIVANKTCPNESHIVAKSKRLRRRFFNNFPSLEVSGSM